MSHSPPSRTWNRCTTASPAERAPRSASPPGACSCSRCRRNWDGYPNHHARRDRRGRQPGGGLHPARGLGRTAGAATSATSCKPGVMVRVGPEQRRRIVPGDDGIRSSRSAACPARSATRRGPSRRAADRWPPEPAAARRDDADVRPAHGPAPAGAARALLPDARLARRRRRRAAGDAAAAWRAIDRFEPRGVARRRGCTGSRPTSACGCSSSARAGRRTSEVGRDLQPYPDALLEQPGGAGRAARERRARVRRRAAVPAAAPACRAAAARRPRLVGGARRRRLLGDSVAGGQQRAAARARAAASASGAEGRLARDAPRARVRGRG